MTSTAALQRTLHAEIPLTQAMGISVVAYDGKRLQLTAPLAPNINHKCTAFGGSLYCLAVTCGWGMVHLKLAEAGLHKHIVIQDADIQYLLPVAEDLIAECQLDHATLHRFLRTLEKHGRARLALEVTIRRGDEVAVRFTGRYVIHS